MNRERLLISIAAALLGFAVSARAQYWVPTSAPYTNWASVACSSDATRLVAASFGSQTQLQDGALIYISADSGKHWIPTSAPAKNWAALASSSDGAKLVAVAGSPSVAGIPLLESGPIVTSSDAGVTWVQCNAPIAEWSCVASSSDGMKLVAGNNWYPGGTNVWTSSDAGQTWNPIATSFGGCGSLAMSADGSRLVVATSDVYTSTNFGGTWTKCTPAAGRWFSVASSADGLKLAAGAAYSSDVPGNYCPIYTSVDGGANWTPTASPSAVCTSIACSADGNKMAAVFGGHIYLSDNGGATWRDSLNPIVFWAPITMTSDGTGLVAGAQGNGGVYTLQSAPRLDVSQSGPGLMFSWPAYASGSGLGPPRDPTTNVVIQATGDLAQGNWTNVTIVPTVTNLLDQVIISSPPSRAFYRLKGS